MTTTTKIELTDETTSSEYGITLYRIRAIEDIPRHGVKKGDLGGWVESLLLENGDYRIRDNAWVADDAQVYGYAQVFGRARVFENARLFGNAQIRGRAQVFGHAEVSGRAKVFGHAEVFGNAKVGGEVWVFGNAVISSSSDYFVMENVGSESSILTLARTVNGHTLSVGCWKDGTLDTLMGKVEERSKHWDATEEQRAYWFEQYRTIHAQCSEIVESWNNE